MFIKNAVEQVIKSGIQPIVLDIARVKNFAGDIEGVRTSLIVNSLDLGVLTANEYRFVARRSQQGSSLVARNIERLFYFYPELKAENKGAKFFTVSVYARTLKNNELYSTLIENFEKFPLVERDKICIELSADLLFEDLEFYAKAIRDIRQLGVKVALCEVGEEFCPLLRLVGLEFDYAFLDKYVATQLELDGGDVAVAGLMSIVSIRPVRIYAFGLNSEEEIKRFESIGCDGYTAVGDPEVFLKNWRMGSEVKLYE